MRSLSKIADGTPNEARIVDGALVVIVGRGKDWLHMLILGSSNPEYDLIQVLDGLPPEPARWRITYDRRSAGERYSIKGDEAAAREWLAGSRRPLISLVRTLALGWLIPEPR